MPRWAEIWDKGMSPERQPPRYPQMRVLIIVAALAGMAYLDYLLILTTVHKFELVYSERGFRGFITGSMYFTQNSRCLVGLSLRQFPLTFKGTVVKQRNESAALTQHHHHVPARDKTTLHHLTLPVWHTDGQIHSTDLAHRPVPAVFAVQFDDHEVAPIKHTHFTLAILRVVSSSVAIS